MPQYLLRTTVAWLLTLVILACPQQVRAHRPIFTDDAATSPDTAIKIEDPAISQVVYREITEKLPQMWLTFQAEEDFKLFIQVGVPVIDRLKDFRPAMVVIGPGLPTQDAPFKLPENTGAKVFGTKDVAKPRFFHEHFTDTDSWILRSETVTLPKAGRYYLVAYLPEKQTGKLWLSVGKKESFSLDDLKEFPAWAKRIQAFHEVKQKAASPLGPGDHTRSLKIGEADRSYLVHVPPKYDPKRPTPVVLVLHGAGTNGAITVSFTGMNKKSDEADFIAVYPNGTGLAGLMLTWNAGGFRAKQDGQADDVAYIGKVLDDLATVASVDPKRVYATGMSNGGMMCYRLAAELSDRIAAIAPVAGTMAIDSYKPKRPVPVMHFHGAADKIVPIGGPSGRTPKFLGFKSVEDTIKICAKASGCPEEPEIVKLPHKVDDGTSVTKKSYGPGKEGTEVVLFVIEGGGHTWPGQQPPVEFIGKSTKNISANDLIWEFFQKHPMKSSK